MSRVRLSRPIVPIAAAIASMGSFGCAPETPQAGFESMMRAIEANDVEAFRQRVPDQALTKNAGNEAKLLTAIAAAEQHGVDLGSCTLGPLREDRPTLFQMTCQGPNGTFTRDISVRRGPERIHQIDPYELWFMLNEAGDSDRQGRARRLKKALEAAGLEAIWSEGGEGYRPEDIQRVIDDPTVGNVVVNYQDFIQQ